MAREVAAVAPAIVANPAEFDQLDSRVAFGRALGEIAENDSQVMAVVSDYGRRLALDALPLPTRASMCLPRPTRRSLRLACSTRCA